MFTKIKNTFRDHIIHPIKNSLSVSGDSLIYGMVMVVAIIGPLFFIPLRAFSVTSSKGFLIVFAGVIGLLVYGIHVLKKGALVIPRQKIFFVLALIALAGFIGSLFSGQFTMSFIGYGFESTSGLFLILFAVFSFFAYTTIHSYERIGMMYGGLVGVTIILAVLHLVRFFAGPAFANMGVLGGSLSTLIGSWSDLGILFGLIALFAVITLELAGLKKVFKKIVMSVGMVAVILLLVMNITIVWVMLGLLALLLSLYLFSFAYWDTDTHGYKKTDRVPGYALALFVIALGGIFFGGFINGIASRYQSLVWNDVRPSWIMTGQVARQSLVRNFATGYGPNTFEAGWSQIKPKALSGQDVSRTSFNQGVGFIPTQIASNGILSGILWVLFFLGILRVLFIKTRQGFKGSVERYFAIVLGVSIVYLSILAWVYLPGSYFIILLGIFLGAFISLFSNQDAPQRDYHISFIKDPRASFFGILGITLMITATLILGYIGIRKVTSLVYYTRGMVALSQGNLVDATTKITRAAAYAPHDVYYQQLTTFGLNDTAQIAAQITTANKENVSKQLEQVLGMSLAYAQAATKVRPSDYKNWILLGDVYRTMVSLGVADTYQRATDAYQEAQKRSPHDTTLDLYFARLELAQKDTATALTLIQGSLDRYPTSDAYIMRAQIQLAQGNNSDARDSLRLAVNLDPYNTDLMYQYALLLLNQAQYRDVITLLQRVISINRYYAQAYVYLGYAYEKIGDATTASQIYEYITTRFPGGAEAVAAVRNGQIDVTNPQTQSETPDTETTTEESGVAPTKKK